MFDKPAGYISTLVVLVTSSFAAWNQLETSAVNDFVAEANRHFETGAKLHLEARPKFEAIEGSLRLPPVDRAELEPAVRELAELYGRSAHEYRRAAAKIEEAAKKSTDPAVTSYFEAKSRRWTVSAEIREVLRDYVLLAVDPTVQAGKDYLIRQEEFNRRVIELNRREKELKAEAENIFTENRSKFD